MAIKGPGKGKALNPQDKITRTCIISESRGTLLGALLQRNPTFWGFLLGSPIRVNPQVILGPGVGIPFLLGLGFPYNPLKTQKGTLFIPRLLLGIVFVCCSKLIQSASGRQGAPPSPSAKKIEKPHRIENCNANKEQNPKRQLVQNRPPPQKKRKTLESKKLSFKTFHPKRFVQKCSFNSFKTVLGPKPSATFINPKPYALNPEP